MSMDMKATIILEGLRVNLDRTTTIMEITLNHTTVVLPEKPLLALILSASAPPWIPARHV